MKKTVFAFVLSLSIIIPTPTFSNCKHSETNKTGIIKQFILENELPITIDEEVIIYGYIETTDRIKFQVFLWNLHNKLVRQVSEGSFSCRYEITENVIEVNRILTAFYNYCANRNLELAIIINNHLGGNEIIIDHLKNHGYNFAEHNGLYILDNDTHYCKLIQLIDFLFQLNISTRYNLMDYFLYDAEFDVVHELILLTTTNNLIGGILFIFNVRNYNLPAFENLLNEITEKNKELERAKMEWTARLHSKQIKSGERGI